MNRINLNPHMVINTLKLINRHVHKHNMIRMQSWYKPSTGIVSKGDCDSGGSTSRVVSNHGACSPFSFFCSHRQPNLSGLTCRQQACVLRRSVCVCAHASVRPPLCGYAQKPKGRSAGSKVGLYPPMMVLPRTHLSDRLLRP